MHAGLRWISNENEVLLDKQGIMFVNEKIIMRGI